MDIYGLITMVVWLVIVTIVGFLFGTVTGRLFTRKTRSIAIIIIYVMLIMILGDCTVMEVAEDLLDMPLQDLLAVIAFPFVTILGSEFGSKFKINISRR